MTGTNRISSAVDVCGHGCAVVRRSLHCLYRDSLHEIKVLGALWPADFLCILHGLKTTALANPLVRSLLHTADSMAWSFSARRQGRNANDWRQAKVWAAAITTRPVQHVLDLFCQGVCA